MEKLKAALSSKTIQGFIAIYGGILVKLLDTVFPEYSKPISMVAVALVTGGGVHGIYGRLLASGPLFKDIALAAAKNTVAAVIPVVEKAIVPEDPKPVVPPAVAPKP